MKLFKKISKKISTIKNGITSAIILCAGNSTRFSSENSKQMALVGSKEVVVRTIEAFENSDLIDEIILVVKKEDTEKYKELVVLNKFLKIKCIVVGGETRQSSAFRGFKHISDRCSYVVIHDGARCLVTPEIISKVLNSAKENGAATAGTVSTDTIKLADANGYVSKTLNRNLIWQIQTPQAFSKKVYTASVYYAQENKIEATDDSALVEAMGHKVKLVECGKTNIKITVKEDIYLAEHYLLLQEANEECE